MALDKEPPLPVYETPAEQGASGIHSAGSRRPMKPGLSCAPWTSRCISRKSTSAHGPKSSRGLCKRESGTSPPRKCTGDNCDDILYCSGHDGVGCATQRVHRSAARICVATPKHRGTSLRNLSLKSTVAGRKALARSEAQTVLFFPRVPWRSVRIKVPPVAAPTFWETLVSVETARNALRV